MSAEKRSRELIKRKHVKQRKRGWTCCIRSCSRRLWTSRLLSNSRSATEAGNAFLDPLRTVIRECELGSHRIGRPSLESVSSRPRKDHLSKNRFRSSPGSAAQIVALDASQP